MLKISPFKSSHQEEIALLMEEIAKEFKQPISTNASSTKNKSLDHYWIATMNNKVVGTIGLIKIKNKAVVLKKMFVKKGFRGRENGVSSSLLQTAFDWCGEENITKIFLGTMRQFKAAHQFYEKNGFTRIEKAKLPIGFFQHPLDDVFYQKNISTKGFYFRTGNMDDLEQILQLAFKSWKGFKNTLTPENWNQLQAALTNRDAFIELLNNSHSIICENNQKQIIGMAYLVPSGNPTEIYEKSWSYIRFVSVDPDFGGRGIGKSLTEYCLEKAREDKEQFVALHTSEMMGKAISIYEKLGFKILRELDPRLGKKYWLYLLELNA